MGTYSNHLFNGWFSFWSFLTRPSLEKFGQNDYVCTNLAGALRSEGVHIQNSRRRSVFGAILRMAQAERAKILLYKDITTAKSLQVPAGCLQWSLRLHPAGRQYPESPMIHRCSQYRRFLRFGYRLRNLRYKRSLPRQYPAVWRP